MCFWMDLNHQSSMAIRLFFSSLHQHLDDNAKMNTNPIFIRKICSFFFCFFRFAFKTFSSFLPFCLLCVLNWILSIKRHTCILHYLWNMRIYLRKWNRWRQNETKEKQTKKIQNKLKRILEKLTHNTLISAIAIIS